MQSDVVSSKVAAILSPPCAKNSGKEAHSFATLLQGAAESTGGPASKTVVRPRNSPTKGAKRGLEGDVVPQENTPQPQVGQQDLATPAAVLIDDSKPTDPVIGDTKLANGSQPEVPAMGFEAGLAPSWPQKPPLEESPKLAPELRQQSSTEETPTKGIGTPPMAVFTSVSANTPAATAVAPLPISPELANKVAVVSPILSAAKPVAKSTVIASREVKTSAEGRVPNTGEKSTVKSVWNGVAHLAGPPSDPVKTQARPLSNDSSQKNHSPIAPLSGSKSSPPIAASKAEGQDRYLVTSQTQVSHDRNATGDAFPSVLPEVPGPASSMAVVKDIAPTVLTVPPHDLGTAPAPSSNSSVNSPRPAAEHVPSLPTVSLPTVRLMDKLGQSEMHIGMRTTEFGSVEVHTVVRESQVGLTISSERGDLRALFSSEIPAIQTTLKQHDLRLDDVKLLQQSSVSDPGAFSGGDSRHRSSQNARYPTSEGRQVTGRVEELPFEANLTPRLITGLNIHA